MSDWNSQLTGVVKLLSIVCLGVVLASPATAGNGNGKNGNQGGSDPVVEPSVMATYRGSAKALDVSVNLLVLSKDLVISDTGELDSVGGSKDESLLEINEDIVQAALLKATTVGSGHQTDSMAQTLGLNLDLTSLGVGLTIGASVLEAGATARCQNGDVALTGYSDIVGLTINGQSIEVGTDPNVSVDLGPLLEVHINEQIVDSYGMTVNALRVVVLDVLGAPVAEVIISQARAGIDCGSGPEGECPDGADFVTGGGFIMGPDGNRVTFSVHGGYFPNGDLKGGMNLVTSGHHIKGSPALGYYIIDETTRQLDFMADDSGQATVCTVTVADNGEPGRDDTFAITCDTGYNTSGVMSQGGNIQLHKPQACSDSKTNKRGGRNR